MTPYEELAGSWELVSWRETLNCNETQSQVTDRTHEFVPFQLDLAYPPTGAATGALSKPDSGATSSFDWVLFGNPARSIRFRHVQGPFHRFERTFDYQLNDSGETLTLRRCWSEVHTRTLTELSGATWVGTAIEKTLFSIAGFGPLGFILAVVIGLGGIPVWASLGLIEILIRYVLRRVRGMEEELHCTRCEEIIFRRREG